MNGAIYGVEGSGRSITLRLRLSIEDEQKVKRLLRKRDWADLPVTVELREE